MSQAGPSSKTAASIDPQALKLLEQVKRRLHSIRTLSAVCTDTHRRLKGVSPSPTQAYVLTSQVRIMRPNLTRIDTTLLSQNKGEKAWNRIPHYRTEACDGQRVWTVLPNKGIFDTGRATTDGRSLPLYNLGPLSGFFNPDDFVTNRIDLMRQEGLLRSLTLVAPAHAGRGASRIVRLVYQRAGSELLSTEEYTIGADLLIHRIRYVSDAADAETTIELSQLRIDAPMSKSSFAFQTPPGMKPRPTASEAPSFPLLAKGTEAPDFTVQDAQGDSVKLSDLRGKWGVLDFWATWCGNCIAAFPGLNAFAAQRKDQDVVVLAISVSDTRQVFQTWLSKHPQFGALRFAIDPAGITGNGFASKLYLVDPLPTQYVIDPNGKVQAAFVGYDPNTSEKRLEEALPPAR